GTGTRGRTGLLFGGRFRLLGPYSSSRACPGCSFCNRRSRPRGLVMNWFQWLRQGIKCVRSTQKVATARRRRALPQLEQLEGRLTPAKLVSPTTVIFQDVDGDDVTVKISRPLFTANNVNNVLKFDTGSVNGITSTKQQLTDVFPFALGPSANGIGVSITASRDNSGNGGDNHVNVGQIDATGLFIILD